MSSLAVFIQACRVILRFRRRILGGEWYLVTSRFDCQERWTRQKPDIHTMVLDREDYTSAPEHAVQSRTQRSDNWRLKDAGN